MNTKLKHTAKIISLATLMFATGFVTARYQDLKHVDHHIANYATFVNNANTAEYWVQANLKKAGFKQYDKNLIIFV